MTVAQLLARISSRELTEWLAYAQLEPFGEERADLRAGIVASTVANVQRDPKKRRRAYTARDFTPTFERKAKSEAELLQTVELLNLAFGGQDLRETERE